MTRPTVDHECIADHCVACCPTAQGYSAGFADAKSFYNTEHAMRLLDGPSLSFLVILLLSMMVTVLVLHARKLHRDNATD